MDVPISVKLNPLVDVRNRGQIHIVEIKTRYENVFSRQHEEKARILLNKIDERAKALEAL